MDDSLIFQNYVRRFLSGNGLSYGPGSTVEGFSSPVWVLLLAGVGKLGLRGLAAAKVISALAGVACVSVLAVAAPKNIRGIPTVVAALLLALDPSFAWWAVSAMETPLYALILTLLTAGAMRQSFWAVGLCGGLAAVARPEGILFTLCAAVWLLLQKSQVKQWTAFVLPFCLLVLPGIAWQAVRFFVYGTFVANSGLAKLGMPAVIGDEGGLWKSVGYIAKAVGRAPGPWLLAAFALPLGWRRICPRRDMAAFSTGAIAAGLLFVLAVGGDFMPRSRFLVPLIPVALFCGAFRWRMTTNAAARRIFLSLAVVGLCVALVRQYSDFDPRRIEREEVAMLASWSAPGFSLQPIPAEGGAHMIAKHILRYTRPGESALHMDIGQSGYLASDVSLIDQFGLVSRFECEYLQGRHTDEELIERVRREKPSLAIEVVDPKTGVPVMRMGRVLMPYLLQNYVLVAGNGWWGGNTIIILARKDVVGRSPDPSRYWDWVSNAPGLAFDHQLILPH